MKESHLFIYPAKMKACMKRYCWVLVICSDRPNFRNFCFTLTKSVLYSCTIFNFLYFREKFFSIVKEQCQSHFKVNIDKVLGHLSRSGTVIDDNVRSLFFGDYMAGETKAYNEIVDFKELTSAMDKYVTLSIVMSILWNLCAFVFTDPKTVLFYLSPATFELPWNSNSVLINIGLPEWYGIFVSLDKHFDDISKINLGI